MKKILIFTALLAVVCIGFAGPAKADSVGTLTLTDCGGGDTGCPGATYSFDVGTTSATLTITINGSVGSTNDFITAVNLGITSNSPGVTGLNLSVAPSTGWTANAGPTSSGGTCGGVSAGFVCASASPLTSLSITTGGVYTWTWTYDAIDPTAIFSADNVHIGAEYGPNSGNFKGLIVSETGAGTTVPEPASMLLLGLGLAGVPFLRRKRS